MGALIVEKAAYEEAVSVIGRNVDVERRLPESPFRRPGALTVYFQPDLVFDGEFWEAFRDLARIYGDTRMYLSTLDPRAAEYYFKEYGSYASIDMFRASSRSEYWEALSTTPTGDEAGAIVFSANVFTVVGDSGSWAFWGDKVYDVGILQAQDNQLSEWVDRFGTFVDMETALEDYIRPELSDDEFQGFQRVFRRNFRLPG